MRFSRKSITWSALPKYLAPYTHCVAISNHRLVALEDGQVTFRYKDYQQHLDNSRQKTHPASRRNP